MSFKKKKKNHWREGNTKKYILLWVWKCWFLRPQMTRRYSYIGIGMYLCMYNVLWWYKGPITSRLHRGPCKCCPMVGSIIILISCCVFVCFMICPLLWSIVSESLGKQSNYHIYYLHTSYHLIGTIIVYVCMIGGQAAVLHVMNITQFWPTRVQPNKTQHWKHSIIVNLPDLLGPEWLSNVHDPQKDT